MTKFTASLLRSLPALPLLILSFSNAALTAALIYVTVPQFDLSFNRSGLISKMEEVSKMTDADVFNLWQVHIASNDRHYVDSLVRDPADQKIVDEFAKSATVMPFSKVITPVGVTSLLSGNISCERVENAIAPAAITQNLRARVNAKHVCFVPIKSGRNELIGYLAMIWKTDKSEEDLLAQVTIARGVMQRANPLF
jgi:hypothetical protein